MYFVLYKNHYVLIKNISTFRVKENYHNKKYQCDLYLYQTTNKNIYNNYVNKCIRNRNENVKLSTNSF